MTADTLVAVAPVLAQDEAPAGAGFVNILLIVGILALFWFLLIRPQQKQQKRQRELVQSLQTGDKVVTVGGLHGTIRSVDEDTISLEIAPSTNVTVSRGRIVQRVTEEDELGESG